MRQLTDNAAVPRKTLKGYAAKGRRLRGLSGPTAGRVMSMSRGETEQIRSWATENGYNPSPADVQPNH